MDNGDMVIKFDDSDDEVVYSFPTKNAPAPGYVLQNSGRGALCWAPVGGETMQIWSVSGVLSVLLISIVGGWLLSKITLRKAVRWMYRFVVMPMEAVNKRIVQYMDEEKQLNKKE